VWEIWDKEHKLVFWYVEGNPKILDVKDDILGLKDFWPCARPMVANLTTSGFMPRPDFAMVQDVYRDINMLMSRIVVLERALRVAGVYDRTAGELEKLLKDEKLANVLIPVDSWASLAEKGGLEGVVSWLPIDQIAAVIEKLEQKLQNRKQLLDELLGLSDLTRGTGSESATGNPPTLGEQQIKSKYANVRVQAAQDELARFATEIQSIRAEVIVKHFDPQTILRRSNVLFTPDAGEAMAAIQGLKDDFPNYRIEVKADEIAMVDFAKMKQERSEFLEALSTLMRDALPLAQMFPMTVPILLETIKWALAGFRGSSSIEGVFDKALQQAQQFASENMQGGQQQQPPDPRMQAEQMKAQNNQAKMQMDMQRMERKAQLDQQKNAADVEAEMQRQAIQTQANIQEAQSIAEIKDRYKQKEHEMKTAEQAMRNITRGGV